MARYRESEAYPTLREALAPEYASLPDEAIAELVDSLYPGADPEDVENVFRAIKRAGRTVGRVAQRALPGVVQGATAGMALGPWGALAGGLAGGALSAASGGSGPRGGGRSGKGGRGGRIARGLGAVAGAAGRIAGAAGAPAAARLLRTLNRPEVGQALSSMALGGAGRGNVSIGGTSVPVGAITTALRSLLQQAEAEHHERRAGESSGVPAYLLREDGEFAVDPTDEDARAERVIELLEGSPLAGEDDEAESSVEYLFEDIDDSVEWEEDEEDVQVAARRLYPGVYRTALDEDQL